MKRPVNLLMNLSRDAFQFYVICDMIIIKGENQYDETKTRIKIC